MIETSLVINGLDCTIGDGNTPEEYEAIAVMLLRAAEAIRNREAGRFECRGEGAKLLASVLVHECGPDCDGDITDVSTIERLACVNEHTPSLRARSHSLIDEYRRASGTEGPRPAQE
jgi:hypothetical protein